MPVEVGCGQCLGCRLEYSRQWAVRCYHEASLYEDNSYITLTYNDANLPSDGSVSVREAQLFMKRLRKRAGRKVRFFLCGEYGEKSWRPHYHALLFGFDFSDKKLWKYNYHKQPLYTSEFLEDLWPFGFSSIGAVSFQSAAYVARYITKKVYGEAAADHYKGRHPEFLNKSTNPGLGTEWFNRYGKEVFPCDFIVVDGVKMRPPRFYMELYKREQAKAARSIRGGRVQKARQHGDNNTSRRLWVREKVQLSRANLLTRKLEDDHGI